MGILGDERRHFLLVSGMARATGTDVAGAFAEGTLSPEDWSGMIERCRGCTWADTCEGWLQAERDQTVDAPDTCVNRTTFEALRSDASDQDNRDLPKLP